MDPFELKGDYIEMIKLLKMTGIAESGAMAKRMVEENVIKVNGEVETRKRAKLKPGDQVDTPLGTIQII